MRRAERPTNHAAISTRIVAFIAAVITAALLWAFLNPLVEKTDSIGTNLSTTQGLNQTQAFTLTAWNNGLWFAAGGLTLALIAAAVFRSRGGRI